MKKLILLSCAFAAAATFGGLGRVFPQVKPSDEAKLAQLVADWSAAPAAKKHKILVCNYLRGCEWHGPSVSYGTRLFALASVKGGYHVDFTDIRQLAIKGLLDEYDAVVLNNTTNFQEAEAPGVSENLLAYVSNGPLDGRRRRLVFPQRGSRPSAHGLLQVAPDRLPPGRRDLHAPHAPLRPLQGARAHLALPRRREHRRRDECSTPPTPTTRAPGSTPHASTTSSAAFSTPSAT